MADILINLMKRKDFTVQEIRSILDTLLDVKSEINEEVCDTTPLYFAIENHLSLDIIELLLKFGADANQKVYVWKLCVPLYEVCFYDCWNDFKFIDIFKILFDYGASVNHDQDCKSSAWEILLRLTSLEIERSIPIVQIMYQNANMSTKTSALEFLFYQAIDYACSNLYETKFAQKNFSDMIKLLLQLGAHPTHGMFKQLFEFALKKTSGCNSKMSLVFIMDLFKILVQYIFVKNFGKEEQFLTYAHDSSGFNKLNPTLAIDCKNTFNVSDLRKEDKILTVIYPCNENKINTVSDLCDGENIYVSEILFDLTKKLWSACFKECRKMQSDILVNKCTVFKTVQDICTAETETILIPTK